VRELYLNAEFDLSLRSRWPGLGDGARARRVRQLSVHFLLAAEPGVSVRVEGEVPASFLSYLEHRGLVAPRLTVAPAVERAARLEPFGWNDTAIRLSRRYDEVADHPPLDVVRRANSRRFAARLERDLGDEATVVGTASGVEELRALLRRLECSPLGWMVKSDHSNAGLGNRRLRSPDLGGGDGRFVAGLLEEDDHVVLERWRPRRGDMCAVFMVDDGGRAADLGVHEVVNTSDGAFIGALFGASLPLVERWGAEVETAARAAAAALDASGYRGPACLDAFVWEEGGRLRLRPLADLNARWHMSAGARRLWRLLGEDSTVYWRLFSRRKLQIPGDHDAVDARLGADAFDPAARRGVLLTSCLELGEGRGRVAVDRIGVAFVAGDREGVKALELRFRERFER